MRRVCLREQSRFNRQTRQTVGIASGSAARVPLSSIVLNIHKVAYVQPPLSPGPHRFTVDKSGGDRESERSDACGRRQHSPAKDQHALGALRAQRRSMGSTRGLQGKHHGWRVVCHDGRCVGLQLSG